jgi:hypothetical protein
MLYVVTPFVCGRTSISWACIDRIHVHVFVHSDSWSAKMQLSCKIDQNQKEVEGNVKVTKA